MNDRPAIPFMPVKGQPPFHLRAATPEEQAMFDRLIREAEARRRAALTDTTTTGEKQ